MLFRGSQFGAFMLASLWLLISYYLDGKKLNVKWNLLLLVLFMLPFLSKILYNEKIRTTHT